MNVKIFCTLWGSEHFPANKFLHLVKEAGYDGVDTWLPENKKERHNFLKKLQLHELSLINHQHQAFGKTITDYLKSYHYYLSICQEGDPVLINSHSGRDYFSFEDQIKVIDMASEFSEKHNVKVLHETHRGRIGYSPSNIAALFNACPEMKITADFSHWVCVTESLHLTGFEEILEEAIQRSGHIHARVGFAEGPQISDPKAPEWKEEMDVFFSWWDRIVEVNKAQAAEVLTITPEFGPYPYMWRVPFTNEDVADQWVINNYMKDLIKVRY